MRLPLAQVHSVFVCLYVLVREARSPRRLATVCFPLRVGSFVACLWQLAHRRSRGEQPREVVRVCKDAHARSWWLFLILIYACYEGGVKRRAGSSRGAAS